MNKKEKSYLANSYKWSIVSESSNIESKALKQSLVKKKNVEWEPSAVSYASVLNETYSCSVRSGNQQLKHSLHFHLTGPNHSHGGITANLN